MDIDLHINLKFAAAELNYPEFKGIPMEKIIAHSLRAGEANALFLDRYSDREIQK